MTKKGFTLIELLIVVSVISILSGITYSVINAGAQRARAEDGVKFTNIEKVSQGIEAHLAAEGSLPPAAPNPTNDPLSSNTLLQNYLLAWPGTDYNYYIRDSSLTNPVFILYVPKSTVNTQYIVYFSTDGRIGECSGTPPTGFTGCTFNP